MGFMDFTEFVNLYGNYRNFGKSHKGAYGTVYVGEKYVIKEQNNISSFIREINIGYTFNHPCLMRIIDWTFDDNKYIFSQPRGENITDAVRNGKISIEQVFSNIYSAIKFLNKNMILHLDIKPCNFVYLNGYTVLIDYGLAIYGCKKDNELVSYNKSGYTITYRDPEFNGGFYNSFLCEYYALAMSIHKMFSKRSNFSEWDLDETLIKCQNDKYQEPFLEMLNKCILPLEERPRDLQSQIEKCPIFEKYPVINGEKILNFYYPEDDGKNIIFAGILSFINDVMNKPIFDCDKRVKDLTYKLLRVSINVIVPFYSINITSNKKSLATALACFILARAVFIDDEEYIIYKIIRSITYIEFNKVEILECICTILSICDGNIYYPESNIENMNFRIHKEEIVNMINFDLMDIKKNGITLEALYDFVFARNYINDFTPEMQKNIIFYINQYPKLKNKYFKNIP